MQVRVGQHGQTMLMRTERLNALSESFATIRYVHVRRDVPLGLRVVAALVVWIDEGRPNFTLVPTDRGFGPEAWVQTLRCPG